MSAGLKPGYKQTEVGVIPEEWKVCALSELVASGPKNGYSGCSGKDARGTQTLALTATSSGRIILNEQTVKRLAETLDPGSDVFLKPGDVLVQRSNTPELVGTTAIFDGSANTYAYPDLMMRLRFKEAVTAHWFWRYANSSNGRRYFGVVAAGSTGTMPKISGDKLRQMPIPLPKFPEQRAIAEALSDVDALLGALEQLIAKKRNIKAAAMQQLLTGHTRLPGFKGEWEVHALGDGIDLVSGHHVLAPHCNTEGEGVPYLTGPSDFKTGSIQHTKFTQRPSTLCAPNDILVTVKGSGSGALIVADAVYCISRQLMAIRVGPWSSRFIYYSLLQNASQIKAASAGLIPGLSRSDILDQLLPIPPDIIEQTAIAEVLSAMDAELTAVEQRHEKTCAFKQGMMQELLTGKTRLV